VLSVAIPAQAQPLFGAAESIECTVVNAEVVVLGTFMNFDGEHEDGTRVATVAVEETLKGAHRPARRVRLVASAMVLTTWKNQARRLLVAMTGDPPAASTVIDLADDDLAVLTADFQLLRRPDQVIQAAKGATRRMPGVTRIDTFSLLVPGELVRETPWGQYYATGGYITLSVPVDERLEARAIGLIGSQSYMERQKGVEALRWFRSAENVERVKALLDDPGWAYLYHAQENRGLEVRIYGIRKAAHETLKYWGVNEKPPRIREEIWKLDEVKLVDLSNSEATAADLKGLTRFVNLEHLFLLNNRVTDAHLKEIGRLKNLRALSIGGTNLTDDSLKHLSELKKLRYLDLGSTQITDKGLKPLTGLPGLRSLDLKQTRVTDQGVAEFRKSRPDVAIER
jgi:hypothetical protein